MSSIDKTPLKAIGGNVREEENQTPEVKSAKRTVEILETLARSDSSLSLSELNRLLGIPKSSLHGILRTLINCEWVNFNAKNNSYEIGLKSLRVGATFLDHDKLINRAFPIMAEFRDRVGETINLGRFDGYNVIYLSSFESGKNLRKYTRIGRSVPAYANAMGKILLSNLNATTIEQIYTKPFDRFTAKTVKDLESLEKEINKTKKDGWAIEHEQSSVGFSCIAVAIHDQFPPINALSVSTRTKLLDQAKIDVLLPELFDAAQRIQDGGALRHIG